MTRKSDRGNSDAPAGSGLSLKALAIGACIGAAAAVLGHWLGPAKPGIDGSVAVSVNGVKLEMVEYQRAAQLFASEKRHEMTDADRSLILERMIEEELLVQYARDRGLTRSNPAVRAAILRGVMAGITTELQAATPTGAGSAGTAQAVEAKLGTYLARMRSTAEIRLPLHGTAQ